MAKNRQDDDYVENGGSALVVIIRETTCARKSPGVDSKRKLHPVLPRDVTVAIGKTAQV